jgi:hypothetical protein
MSNKIWLAVDEDGTPFWYTSKPTRRMDGRGDYWNITYTTDNDASGELFPGCIKTMIGRELTWADEPVEYTPGLVESSAPVPHPSNTNTVLLDLATKPVECTPGESNIRKALENLVHLHMAEQEGIDFGRPTPDQWLDAVEEAVEALKSMPGERELKVPSDDVKDRLKEAYDFMENVNTLATSFSKFQAIEYWRDWYEEWRRKN